MLQRGIILTNVVIVQWWTIVLCVNRVIHHSRIFSHLGPAYLRPCRMSCQMSDYEILVMCYAKHEEPCARYHRGILRVNFIIKSGLIRGKPSCAATWTKSFASAEIADSRQILDFQILDPSICAAQTLSHSLNLFSVVQMENLQNHRPWP